MSYLGGYLGELFLGREWDSVASLRHPCPCGGPMHEYGMDAGGLETTRICRTRGALKRAWRTPCTTNAATFGRGVHPFRDSVGIRTQDPQLRRLLLYPAELRNQTPLKRECKVR